MTGPVAVPASTTTLSSLSIPTAGKYVIWAKGTFQATASGLITCLLVAGADIDLSQTWAATSPFYFALPLQLAHEYTAPGTADFRCAGTGTATALYIKITAIKVANLTNS